MFNLFKKKDKERKEQLLFALNIILHDVAKWNKETFPDATLAGQLSKLEEEFKEFDEAKEENQMKELADIFIVLGGLKRFESVIGAYIEEDMIKQLTWRTLGVLICAICDKMEINRKRVWKKSGDGKFHHEEVKKK